MAYPNNVKQHRSSRQASAAPATAVFVGTDGTAYYRDERNYNKRYYTFNIVHQDITESEKNQILNDYFAISGGMTAFRYQGDFGSNDDYTVKYLHEPIVIPTHGMFYTVRTTLHGYRDGDGP